MRRALLVTIVLALAPAAVAAADTRQLDLVCPIGGEKFSQRFPAPGAPTGIHLDTRPAGPVPTPWPLARCPGNGFVVFSENLSAEDIARLEPLVASAEYQRLRKSETSYFLAAYLMEKLAQPASRVAYALVQASWEAGTREQQRRYLEQALTHYRRALNQPYPNAQAWIRDQLLSGEIERRLGLFAEATTRFSTLLLEIRIEDKYARVARYQLELIAKKDSEPRRLPAPGK